MGFETHPVYTKTSSKMFSPANIERVLERAYDIRRNLPQTRQSLYPSIIENSHRPETHSARSEQLSSFTNFNSSTALYTWPVLPNSPYPPLPSVSEPKAIHPSSSVPVLNNESLTPNSMSTSRRSPFVENTDSEAGYIPSSGPPRVKQEECDPCVSVPCHCPVTSQTKLDDPDSRSDTDSRPAGRMILAIDGGPRWSDYATETKTSRGEGGSIWKCHWSTTSNGISKRCTYTGKKQLVRRHIETTHLRKKWSSSSSLSSDLQPSSRPYECEYCNDRFPQKTSLKIHVSSKHTKDYPWQCPDCPSKYNDPARLHRHRMGSHQYVPRDISRNSNKVRNNPKPKALEKDPFEIIPYAQYH
ncbi:hypothetical protein D9758_001072 [Tetrapyrgos nigripes]|uniref:C2H2-type domain-containing protein n=1 Tax=Tetrapyrgos nigripes TaxID=182062 RepID=A0A8H5LUK3_9AGAR|nr:hypothetical protein D9758_001072 [Tetrapyrgos nigripes]